MNTGRPAKSPRSTFGARVHKLREAAGLTQQEVAARLGIAQPSYALWERREVSVTASQLLKLADLFGCRIEDFFHDAGKPLPRRAGPTGRARRTFEKVSKVSRSRQKKILDVVDALLHQIKD